MFQKYADSWAGGICQWLVLWCCWRRRVEATPRGEPAAKLKLPDPMWVAPEHERSEHLAVGSNLKELYASPNGDRWYVCYSGESRAFVRSERSLRRKAVGRRVGYLPSSERKSA